MLSYGYFLICTSFQQITHDFLEHVRSIAACLQTRAHIYISYTGTTET